MTFKKFWSVGAPVLAFVTVLVVGYLASQTEGVTKGFLFDLSGMPATAVAKRFPWELQISTVLFGLAAVAAYRKTIESRASRIAVLAVLVLTAIAAAGAYETVHAVRTNLFAITLVNGGTSSFNLAMIAVVLADLIFKWRREPGNDSESEGPSDQHNGHDRENHPVP